MASRPTGVRIENNQLDPLVPNLPRPAPKRGLSAPVATADISCRRSQMFPVHRARSAPVPWIPFDQRFEGQHTVVTERRGLLKGRRVVRGRELECKRIHQNDHSTDTRRNDGRHLGAQ